jgi:hypothetical protein
VVSALFVDWLLGNTASEDAPSKCVRHRGTITLPTLLSTLRVSDVAVFPIRRRSAHCRLSLRPAEECVRPTTR